MADGLGLQVWVVAALKELGGEGTVTEIARWIWENHESELRASGDHFYTWQYEMRWAGQKLQQMGVIRKERSPRGWILLK